ncbi:hypothetical protein BBJ28_00014289 [Nothophytophthora sp. Chile5]|nr:hypothetical protein BBJ28_00014289 [Nothophytophthora sp. Chile5]
MESVAFPLANQPDEDEAARAEKKKEKAKKPKAKKEAVKTTPISLNDRVAEILKRTGSTQFQSSLDDESDEDESANEVCTAAFPGNEAREPVAMNKEDGQQSHSDDEEQRSGHEESDEARLSLSDSLGMESADFEVRQRDQSSLNSEKFAVNLDALADSGLGAKTHCYQSENCHHFADLFKDDDSATEKDLYDDEDFELDQTTAGDQDVPPAGLSSAQCSVHEAPKAEQEQPFVKVATDKDEEQGDDDHDEEQRAYLSENEVDAEKARAVNASGSFGYEDDDFEYEDDTFEPELSVTRDETASQRSQVATEAAQGTSEAPGGSSTHANTRLDALLAAKYGDFYALDEEDEEKAKETPPTETQQEQETREDSASVLRQPLDPTDSSAAHISAPVPEVPASVESAESPPSSPPPPPPPADEDDAEDQELNAFTLEPTSIQGRQQIATVKAPAVASATAARGFHPPAPSATDRFRLIESHVASLRFLPAASVPAVAVSTDARLSAPARESVFSPASAPPAASLSLSFDGDLLLEEKATQREIDELLRSSQVFRQSQEGASLRTRKARENGLVLRLQQAQRQILQLKTHIQATAASSDPPTHQITALKPECADPDGPVAAAERVESSTLSRAAFDQLEKEIKTQDSLIAAFQKENERLMRQLKQAQQDVQYDVHEANEELRRQLRRLQDQAGEVASDTGDNTSKARYRVAVEARLEAEAHALALQEELAAVRLTHQQKVNELTLELNRVKKAKVELECRYEGVDLSQVAQEAQQVKELQNELALAKKEHVHALNALQKKLDWYVENQRLLDDQDEELKRLRLQVAGPVSEVAATPAKPDRHNAQAGGPSPMRSHRRSPADIRHIQELEARLSELEEAMRRRHPDSLANLILASRRADEESKARTLEREYEEKLAALSRELEQAQETSETRLASFRQQQEKLLLQYRRKLKEQEKQLKQLAKPPLTHKPLVKDANGATATAGEELKRVRRFYADKIKDLERKWEAKYRAQRKQQFASLGRMDGHQQQELGALTYADSALVVADLQQQLRERELELKQEKARADQLATANLEARDAQRSSEAEDPEPRRPPRSKERELEERVQDLEAQLRDSESARGRLVQTLSAVQSLSPRPSPAADSIVESTAARKESQQSQAELMQLRGELVAAREALANEHAASREKSAAMEAQAVEQVEKSALLQTQLAVNVREVQTLQTLALEAERHNRLLEAQAKRVPTLEQKLLALRRELELPRSPSMLQYRTLELQVETLAQKHQLREAELKVVLDRALASSRLEQLSRERAHRTALGVKNAEIATFKRQLEEILDELALLQAPPSSRPLAKAPALPEAADR